DYYCATWHSSDNYIF
nr:immunoglobulin light chain junction region [Macaca mulatta]